MNDRTTATARTEAGPATDGQQTHDRTDAVTRTFVRHRNLLFTVAYELLGSAADAEDALQETWLRWAGVDPGTVRQPRAYLVRIATRQALSQLRALGRRKESYVGPWLPEPLLTAPDVAEDVELAESVSMAMMLVMETLAPTERAVFVLREVFDLGYDEIAEAVGKSPAAVRQIAHRARAHVAARRPRGAASEEETRRTVEAFRRAVETGDLQRLLDTLAPDVVLLTDGGGVVRAALAPVVGADQVARVLARLAATASLRPAKINGAPALTVHPAATAGDARAADTVDTVLALRVADGLVTGLYAVRNPEKLHHLHRETPLRRHADDDPLT
ncbi:RNA polymerase sigma-70 factor [Streptomyces sp. NRRL F-5727]|uniref:RNA polymerase sigma-70 factor n=1 Tax=Streptomyces sp. NRRL F-5727 TaxID=1463871 RepID=UPI0004C7832E|nr:RNA polymerase sigma-70 factor [Streptomyces sp. NRRL F-5727]